MRKSIFILIVLFLQISFGQNPKQKDIDSLLISIKKSKVDTVKCNNYNFISNLYLYVDIDKGLEFGNKAMALSKRINWTKGIGISHTTIGTHLISKGDYENALQNLEKAEKIFLTSQNNFELANAYNQLGILSANQSKFPESLDYFFKALNCYEKATEKSKAKNIASIYQNIANIYNATENFDKALLNYNKAIELFKKIPNKEINTAINIASKGIVLQKQNKNKEALIEHKKAESILMALKNEVPLVFVKSWIGATYLALKDYKLSLEYSKNALEIIKKMGDQELLATTFQNFGYAYFQKGKELKNTSEIQLGFENLSNALTIHKTLKNHEGLTKDYLYLSEYYRYKNDFKKSLETYEMHAMYNDSIFNFKNKQSLQNLEDTRTIEIRNKEIQLNKITLENKEKQKWYLIEGLLLLTTIGSLLFYQSRNRRKINKKLQLLNSELDQANKTKTRFFSILNHDLRAPVANLIGFLHLTKNSPELLDEQSIKRMQDKTMTGAENLLSSMEDILQWSKSQMENFKPQPQKIFVSSLFEDIKNHFDSEESVIISFENPNNIQIKADENYLKTIIRNLTGNSIKALITIENPTIVWKTWQESTDDKENNQTFLSITDNGNGATDEQFKALYDENEVVGIKSGLGLHLIRDLAKAINCEIKVESKNTIGTTFILKL